MYERTVPCQNPDGCGYMATEMYREGADKVTGICTKCGYNWHHDRAPLEPTP